MTVGTLVDPVELRERVVRPWTQLEDFQEAQKARSVAVVAPHCDDAIIGVGGSVRRHLEVGDKVYFIDVTYGDASCPEYPQDVFTGMRIEEELRAADTLGLPRENLIFLPELYQQDSPLYGVYPPPVREGGLYPGRLNERVVFHYLMEALRRVRPQVVYIPYGGPLNDSRRHPDHTIVSDQALIALRFAPGKYFREYGEVWESFSVKEGCYYEIDVPFDYWRDLEGLKVVDITDFWDRKISALREYSSQNVAFFEERMLRWMAERGFSSDHKYEVFRRIELEGRSGNE